MDSLTRSRAHARWLPALLIGAAAALLPPRPCPGACTPPARELVADVDGDGVADTLAIMVGFDAAAPAAGGITATSGAGGHVLYSISGEGVNDHFGYAAAVADLNADGAMELLVTAPGAGGDGAGRIYVFAGATGQLARSVGADGGLRIGLAIETIADQDADGWRELVVEGGAGGPPWEGRNFIYSGGTGALLASRAMTAGGIARFVAGGGRAVVAADLDDSGTVDAADIVRMASELAGDLGGPGFDVNRDGLVDSADLAAVVEAVLRGDRSVAGWGVVTEVEGEAEAMRLRWSEVHADGGLLTSWSRVTHNAPSSDAELAGSEEGQQTAGGGGGGLPGQYPCPCGDNPVEGGVGLPPCPSQMDGCPTEWVELGRTMTLTPPRPDCEYTIIGDTGILEPVAGQPGVYRAVGYGCITVEVRCESGCCTCQRCDICVGPPQCPAAVGFTDCADACSTSPISPFPIDRLGRLVVHAVGSPPYPHPFYAPEGWVYDWSVQLSDGCNVCPGPACEPCANGCWPWYRLTTGTGELKLWEHPAFAALTPVEGQVLWIRVRYRPVDCTPTDCCADPYLPACCYAESSCTLGLYERDAGLDSDSDGYCDWEEDAAGSDPGDATSMPAGRLTDADGDTLSRLQDVPGPVDYDPWTGAPRPGPELFDTDGDGAQDLAELDLGLSPETRYTVQGQVDRYAPEHLLADLDQDLAYDVYERRLGLDPSVRDSDGDGIVDGIELRTRLFSSGVGIGTDPLVSHRRESADSDGDGLSDFEEVTFYGTDPGLGMAGYFLYRARDTDRDGLSDFFEVRAGLNPRSPYSEARTILVAPGFPPILRDVLGPHDSVSDTDFDGLRSGLEQLYGTDPTLRDSDGDGVSDGEEVDQGSSPTDPSDGGEEPGEPGEPRPREDTCWMLVTINGGHHPDGCGDVDDDDDPRPPGPGDGTGIGEGGMNDDKLPNVWIVTITIGDLNGDGDTDDPGERIDVPTGPNGERTTLLIPFRRGRCYEFDIGGYRRPGWSHDAYYFQIVPVDPLTLDDPRPAICTTCCCVVFDDPDGMLGNHCFVDPSEHNPVRMCLPLVDVDVDSDNDDGFAEPARSTDEGRVEDEAGDDQPGKVVLANSGDSDGDGIPDYADGYDLDGVADSADDIVEGEQFIPVVVEAGGFAAPEDVRITFGYAGSDPAAVSVADDPDGVNGPVFTLPASGTMRLWMRAGGEERNKAGAPTGDYIVPGQAYTLEELGFGADGGTITLWAEAVRPSAAMGDLRIASSHNDCPGEADAARLTAFDTRFAALNEAPGGAVTLGPVLGSLPLSQPSPVLAVDPPIVSPPRISLDYTTALVDISLSGAVDDAIADLTPGTDGQIEALQVLVNGSPFVPFGQEEPVNIPLSVTKTDDPGSVLHRYDYSGTFQAVMQDVPVGPGWNSVTLLATNAKGFTGYAEFGFKVKLVSPPGGASVRLQFTGLNPYESPDPIIYTYRLDLGDGAPFEDTQVLYPSDFGKPGHFDNDPLPGISGYGPVRVVLPPEELQSNVLDELVVTLIDERLGDAAALSLRVRETGDDTRTFIWPRDPGDPPSQDLRDHTAILEQVGPMLRSEGGVDAPFAIVLQGPDGLWEQLVDVRFREDLGAPAYGVSQLDGLFVLARPDADVALALRRIPSFEEALAQIGPPLPPADQMGHWAMARGFGAGLVATGEECVDGIYDLAATVGDYNPSTAIVVDLWISFEFGGQIAGERRRMRLAETWQGIQDTVDMAGTVLSLVVQLHQDQGAFVVAALTGDHETINELGEEYRMVFKVLAGIWDEIRAEVIETESDYDFGWYMGRITGEVVLMVTGEAAAARLTQLSKARVLQSVAPRLEAALRARKPALADKFLPGGPVLVKAQRLLDSHICFVAGTAVLTPGGPAPIESIVPGDLVLSRDEATGEQAYKRVSGVIVTHPTTLYTLAYAASEGGEEGSITGTGVHPFWSVDAGAFVPMEQLRVGDALLLADGVSTAFVTDIQVQRGPPAAGENQHGWDGSAYTTYNFEVEGFRTYFAGSPGVWVHNAGDFDCQDFVDHLDYLREKHDWNLRQAFDEILRLSYPKNWPEGSPARATAERLAAKYDPNLTLAAREVMVDAYSRAVQGGVVDLSEVHTVRQLREVLGFERGAPWNPLAWHNGRASASALEVHHTASIRVGKNLLERLPAFENLTPAQWADLLDEMPGFLINNLDGRPGAGPAHQALTTAINAIDLGTDEVPRPVGEVFGEMAQKYLDWDPVVGPDVWRVARAWLESKGVTP